MPKVSTRRKVKGSRKKKNTTKKPNHESTKERNHERAVFFELSKFRVFVMVFLVLMKFGVFMWRFMVVMLLLLGTLVRVCTGQEFHGTPIALSDQVDNGGTYAGIRLLGALRLPSTVINGTRLCGLSGLAWDEDAELLYAISDGGGLFHLKPEFDDRGYLRDVRLVAGPSAARRGGKSSA